MFGFDSWSLCQRITRMTVNTNNILQWAWLTSMMPMMHNMMSDNDNDTITIQTNYETKKETTIYGTTHSTSWNSRCCHHLCSAPWPDLGLCCDAWSRVLRESYADGNWVGRRWSRFCSNRMSHCTRKHACYSLWTPTFRSWYLFGVLLGVCWPSSWFHQCSWCRKSSWACRRLHDYFWAIWICCCTGENEDWVLM